MRRTIRSKLILLVFVPLALAVALTTAVSAWREAYDAAAAAEARLAASAAVLATFAGAALQQEDSGHAADALRSVAEAEHLSYARIELQDGRVLSQIGARPAQPSGSGPLASLFQARLLEASQPVTVDGRRLGAVVMVSRTESAFDLAKRGLAFTGFGAGVAAILGLLVAFRLQRGISAPIVGLTQAMSSVRSSHDYALEADIDSDDEVGDLIDGFNQMLQEIRDRDARLAGHMQTLEREVADRTAEIRVAKDVAEAANASKSDFLATMSHEIRTPMNGIMVMAEMLASTDLPARQRRYAQIIANSGQSLLSIINDILDFSKIEAGKMELELTPVDLADLVDDVTGLFWERARSKSIDLAAYVDPATPRKVMGDPVRLRQVIGNLVNNAIKFTESGGVLVRVEPVKGAIRVSIQDTGIGISQSKIAGLFEAFTQADQSTTRRFGGTGLGLAICKRLIDAMGGRINAASDEGKGSTFTFIFPAEVVEPAEPWPDLSGTAAAQATLACAGVSTRWALARYLRASGVELNASQPGFFLGEPQGFGAALPRPAVCLADYGDPEPLDRLRAKALDAVLIQPFRRSDLEAVLTRLRDGRSLEDLAQEDTDPAGAEMPRFDGRRVLVADDSAVNREVAVEALSRLGAQALIATDGRSAMELARADPTIDLILMDGSMPEMDGFDASRAIRAEEQAAGRRRVPIVALTAHVVGAASDAWRQAQMDAILHKPFTLQGLADTLRRFLEPSGVGLVRTSVAASAAMDDELLDPTVVRELSAMAASGNGDFVDKVRRLYRANAPDSLGAAQAAAAIGDGEGLARAAHALKSMSLNVGAKRLAALCSVLESRGRSGAPVAPEALVQLADTLTETLEALGGDSLGLTPSAALLADLKAAIRAGDLYMLYQPQMDRLGQELVGCEALVRWTHPERGAVSPAEFVPLAEQSGIISDLTDFVVRRVCSDMRSFPTLRVAFNASALEFSRAGFAERLGALIAEQNFDPTRLEVEITETAVVGDAEHARANIVKLREMGVKVALDDFGAGYTSLRFLRMFPFDKLKIDREFIQDCDSDAEAATIIHAVVSVGRALGMKVVAEGVETEAQRNFLKVAGVHALQGWLFGKAMPPQELAIKYGLSARPVPRRVA